MKENSKGLGFKEVSNSFTVVNTTEDTYTNENESSVKSSTSNFTFTSVAASSPLREDIKN